MLGWKRVRFALGGIAFAWLLFSKDWSGSVAVLFVRLFLVGMLGLLAFGLFERWPAHLPPWLARWVLQVVGVALAMPLGVLIAYLATTYGDPVPFWEDRGHLHELGFITLLGLLLAPWMAVSALVRQIRGDARNQALAFELERSELERKALDARLRLLQAQVEPHFLFNTLANVRELVDAGSSQAAPVLGSLIAYLRAAVPRLHEPITTLEHELQLVRAYLEVMHMRMPDRLQFSLHADDAALPLHCPPMALLTLVENAVRHGIDPSEDGGRIEIRVAVKDDRCRAEVVDTGVGIHGAGNGLGTGLANLRERLRLTFRDDASLRLHPVAPHGVCAELDFPAQRGAA
jgi:signal transduction histidine kinase